MSKRAKFVLVTWVGQNVSVMKKAKMSTDKALLKDIIQVSASWWIHGLFEARPFVFLTIQDTVVLQCTTVRWKFHPSTILSTNQNITQHSKLPNCSVIGWYICIRTNFPSCDGAPKRNQMVSTLCRFLVNCHVELWVWNVESSKRV